jgi:hypothetical protein
MGLFDTFIDEKAHCPKCGTRQQEWQTKYLASLSEVWHVGEILQYHFSDSPKKKQSSHENLPSVLVLSAGEVSVHHTCPNPECRRWLEGVALIRKWRFVGIRKIRARKLRVRKSSSRKLRNTDWRKDPLWKALQKPWSWGVDTHASRLDEEFA